MNNLRHIRGIIYRLKRDFGSAIKIITVSAPTVDYKTGVTVPSETETSVRYALVLPVKIARQSFITVPQFPYGAVEDSNLRIVVIDIKDCSVVPTLNDYVEYAGLRYSIKDVDATALDNHVLISIQSAASTTV